MRVFRGFDWLSSVSGSKIMAKNAQFIREIAANPLEIINKFAVLWP